MVVLAVTRRSASLAAEQGLSLPSNERPHQSHLLPVEVRVIAASYAVGNLYESRDGREWPGGSAAYHGVPLAPLGQVMDAALSADVPPPGFLASGYGKCRFCMGQEFRRIA